MKTLASAQMDFRSNDRDDNGINDFWRGDVAGLYGFVPLGGFEPMRLIEASVAAADVAPARSYNPGMPTLAPYNGYWFKALPHADEGVPSPDRWAACAYPIRYAYRFRWTYIISEENTVYRKKVHNPRLLTMYPADPAKEGWKTLE